MSGYHRAEDPRIAADPFCSNGNQVPSSYKSSVLGIIIAKGAMNIGGEVQGRQIVSYLRGSVWAHCLC